MSIQALRDADRLLLREQVFSWMSQDRGLSESLLPPPQLSTMSEEEKSRHVQHIVNAALCGDREAAHRVLTRETACHLRREAQVLATSDIEAEQVIGLLPHMISEVQLLWECMRSAVKTEDSGSEEPSCLAEYVAAHVELVSVLALHSVHVSLSTVEAVSAAGVRELVSDILTSKEFVGDGHPKWEGDGEGQMVQAQELADALGERSSALRSMFCCDADTNEWESDVESQMALLRRMLQQYPLAGVAHYVLAFVDAADLDQCWLIHMLRLEKQLRSAPLNPPFVSHAAGPSSYPLNPLSGSPAIPTDTDRMRQEKIGEAVVVEPTIVGEGVAMQDGKTEEVAFRAEGGVKIAPPTSRENGNAYGEASVLSDDEEKMDDPPNARGQKHGRVARFSGHGRVAGRENDIRSPRVARKVGMRRRREIINKASRGVFLPYSQQRDDECESSGDSQGLEAGRGSRKKGQIEPRGVPDTQDVLQMFQETGVGKRWPPDRPPDRPSDSEKPVAKIKSAARNRRGSERDLTGDEIIMNALRGGDVNLNRPSRRRKAPVKSKLASGDEGTSSSRDESSTLPRYSPRRRSQREVPRSRNVEGSRVKNGGVSKQRTRRSKNQPGVNTFSFRKDEDLALVKYIDKFGYGEWSKILNKGMKTGVWLNRSIRELRKRAQELAESGS